MTKQNTAAAASLTSTTAPAADDPHAMWDDLYEAPASPKPVLRLVPAPEAPAPAPVPPAVSEEPSAPEAPAPAPAPVPGQGGLICGKCNSRCAADIWNEEYNMCSSCARPLIRKARKAAAKAREAERKAREAARKAERTCPVCGKGKSHKWPTCKACAPKPEPKGKGSGKGRKPRRPSPAAQAERNWQRRQSHVRCQGVGCNQPAVPGMGFCRECLGIK